MSNSHQFLFFCGPDFRRWRHYSAPRKTSSIEDDSVCPGVTIIRPVKGLDPSLYECLASTLRQSYPQEKLTTYICVADRTDPAVPVIQRVLHDFPCAAASLLFEDDSALDRDHMGPNPKIRNMSAAYARAQDDIVWIIDCNTWVAPGTCGRMVEKLIGGNGQMPYKFVHLLPLVVEADCPVTHDPRSLIGHGGGRLEESFMSSAHAKFYTAINTVSIAPCIVGKSNMFRKSHLDALTEGQGIGYFSHNICEDHLIGDLLWKTSVPEEHLGRFFGKHALVSGDLAIQPISAMSVRDYISRRVRWLRVRKWTVLAATLVEPTTESFLCSCLGAYAYAANATDRGDFQQSFSYSHFAAFWIFSVAAWCAGDWILYGKLHSAATITVDKATPAFIRHSNVSSRRVVGAWLVSWLSREALALPIWLIAVFGGATVRWRGKKFRVGMDTRVHACDETRGPHPASLRTDSDTYNHID